jgi:hypothetical protein
MNMSTWTISTGGDMPQRAPKEAGENHNTQDSLAIAFVTWNPHAREGPCQGSHGSYGLNYAEVLPPSSVVPKRAKSYGCKVALERKQGHGLRDKK